MLSAFFPGLSLLNSLFDAGKKFSGADHELFSLALEHDRRLPGGERGSVRDSIELAVKLHPLPDSETPELQVVRKRIDFFHYRFHTTSWMKS